MDCGSSMSKMSNGRKGAKRVYYLRCKLYADRGEEKLCTRYSIRLDRLIDLVLERLRHYVQSYYTLEELELEKPQNTKRNVLLHEQKVLTTQLKKWGLALKNLYLDKVSGVLSEGQFMDLNQNFLAEKSRLELRLVQIGEELAEQEQPKEQEDLMEKARERLQMNTLLRELAVAFIEKIEIREQNPDIGQQEVTIHWKFREKVMMEILSTVPRRESGCPNVSSPMRWCCFVSVRVSAQYHGAVASAIYKMRSS